MFKYGGDHKIPFHITPLSKRSDNNDGVSSGSHSFLFVVDYKNFNFLRIKIIFQCFLLCDQLIIINCIDKIGNDENKTNFTIIVLS